VKAATAVLTSLHAATYESTNSLIDPEQIVPSKTTEGIPAGAWHHTVPALTIQVIDIPTR
jgi:alpha-N-arabinofuranosidase